MAKISMELELLNKICHQCDCMINGQKKTTITEDDVNKDIEIKDKDYSSQLPLYSPSWNPQNNEKKTG